MNEWGTHSFAHRASFLFLVLVGSGDRWAFVDFLPVLKVADGAVVAGNDLLAFGQAIGDFPIVVVANADFDRDHFGVVAFMDEDHLDGLGGLLGFRVAFGDVGSVGGGGVGDAGFDGERI